jgi:hypothetical protein
MSKEIIQTLLKGKTAGIKNIYLALGGAVIVGLILWKKGIPSFSNIHPAQSKTITTTLEGAQLFGIDECTQQLAEDESSIQNLSPGSQRLVDAFFTAYGAGDQATAVSILQIMAPKIKLALTNWLLCKGTMVKAMYGEEMLF